ncbi:MAG TPA: response regulator transcription factor [Candidatus Didemnitutus sp.]|nr:response regulator transcription factor [Candidatus Didemnitutus sp.]
MNGTKTIKVLVAEDHGVVREGLCGLLEADGGFEIVGQAKTGREAVEMARLHRPDVILMDIAMPILNGLEATRQVLLDNAQAKVLVLSAHSDDLYVERVNAVGAAGFLEKQSSVGVLTEAIREVANGKSFVTPTIAKRMRDNIRSRTQGTGVATGSARLTPREAEVLQLVAEGSANKQVAADLNISVKTVEKHRQKVMNKLNIHDTAGLTRYAIAAGIIESSIQPTTG